jgi:hypothetical protein
VATGSGVCVLQEGLGSGRGTGTERLRVLHHLEATGRLLLAALGAGGVMVWFMAPINP